MPDPTQKPPPDDVQERFDLMCNAARHDRSLCVVGYRTADGKPAHYVVGVVLPDGNMIPLAIIPTGLSITQYLDYFDLMAGKVGGAELDPDFKGVRQ
jgi:hypothetical protein